MSRGFLPERSVRARTFLPWLAAASLAALLTACGGGGGGGAEPAAAAAPVTSSTPTSSTSTPTSAPAGTSGTPVSAAANVVPITIDQGTDGTALNSPFVSVTVCQPGTQTCKTIDHILVDTGSTGLRVSASALSGVSLPNVNANSGTPYGECAMFASGYTWGSVRSADVHLAGEQANAIPVQVYNDSDPSFAKPPAACSNTGVPLDAAGSKGILGVGLDVRDCGAACVSSTAPGMYYTCTATGCSSSVAPLSAQLGNPAALLASSDNNGIAIVLPDIPTGGVSSLTGSLILGIGTQGNNQLSGHTVYTADSRGNFSTTYNGRTTSGFIDSGSNGLFFADSSIAQCSSGFYCPASPLTLSATVTGANSVSGNVSFVVESEKTLPSNTAAAHLGGTVVVGSSFDWGLPFFLGRTVFVGFTGMNTPGGAGPFWAF